MANCYIITYDLKKRGTQDYTPVYEAIKWYGTWAHINDSTWAVVTDENASQIRDKLVLLMEEDDSLFVLKSGKEAAWKNVVCKSEWLKNNL